MTDTNGIENELDYIGKMLSEIHDVLNDLLVFFREQRKRELKDNRT